MCPLHVAMLFTFDHSKSHTKEQYQKFRRGKIFSRLALYLIYKS